MDQFNGEKVFLRKASESDVPFLSPWLKTSNCNLDIFPGMTSDVIQLIESPKDSEHIFIIEDTSHTMIGYIFTYFCDRKNGTFSYYIFINPPYRRQGAAKESIRILLNFYFQELRFQKVTIPICVFNKAAATLHDRLEFKLEGRIRRMLYSHGQFFDLLTYGITHEEFDTIAIDIEDHSEKIICDN